METKKTDNMALFIFSLIFIIGVVGLFYGLLFVFSSAGYIAAKLAVAGGDLLTEIYNLNTVMGLVLFGGGLLLFSLGIMGLNKYWRP